MNLDEQVEVAPGEYKRLGDCNRADLEAAAELYRQKAADDQAVADMLRRHADLD